MYVLTKQFNKLLICNLCQGKFTDPRILPCGVSFCDKCINESTCDTLFKKCSCDDKEHAIPENGFTKNKTIIDFLEVPSLNLYRGERIEDFKAKLEIAKEEIYKLETGLNHSENKIRDHFSSIVNEIDLATEKIIQTIHGYRDDLLTNVRKYEQECLKKIIEKEHFTECRSTLETSLKKTKSFHDNWNDSLENLKNSSDVYDAIEMFEKLKKPEKNSTLLDTYLFQNIKMIFNSNKNEIMPSIIGSIEFKNVSCLINFEKLKRTGLQKLEICKNQTNIRIFDANLSENGTILMCFAYRDLQSVQFCELDKINNKIVNCFTRKYNNDSRLKIDCVKFQRKYDKLILQIRYSDQSSTLYNLNINNYEVLFKHDFRSGLTDFGFDSEKIFCLENKNVEKYYDFEFKYIDLEYEMEKSDYIIIRKNNDHQFYIKFDGLLEVFSTEYDKFLPDVEIKTDLFSVLDDSTILYYDSNKRTLVYKNLDGDIEFERKVPDGINPSIIKFNKTDYIIYDQETNCLYF